MKNLLSLFILATSFQVFAQESALLRVNYTEGDIYTVSVIQKQSNGVQGGTDMTISMDMEIVEESDESFETESKITSIVMDMNQGGMSMSYDSSKSEDELDETGKMIKSQLSPMMNAVISSTIDIYGNTLKTSVEPAAPGMEQFTAGQAAIRYPKEEVSVGSTWTTDNESQRMNVKTTYTVTKIADGIVYLSMKGDVSGVGTGSMTGTSEIEMSTGTARNTENEITVSTQGMEVTVASQVLMTKR